MIKKKKASAERIPFPLLLDPSVNYMERLCMKPLKTDWRTVCQSCLFLSPNPEACRFRLSSLIFGKQPDHPFEYPILIEP